MTLSQTIVTDAMYYLQKLYPYSQQYDAEPYSVQKKHIANFLAEQYPLYSSLAENIWCIIDATKIKENKRVLGISVQLYIEAFCKINTENSSPVQ